MFNTPLSILKQSLIFIPVFVFFIGLYNFKLSLANAKLNNFMNKERDFYSYIKENSFKEKELFESLDKKKLFNALFKNDLKFNLEAKKIIDSFYQKRGSHGLLSLIKDEKKETYKNNLITISTFFGMTLEEEIDTERMDEIVDLLCGSIKEIILIWFSIKIDNK
ncbi:retron Ec48 family effector membrane protein [Pantoea stewartii]|uniref:retron Ec48 family effector membrane protein n=1 Tax=Pantoea stewartii TaxID=66269 RepID=UPI001CF7B5CC|nr:retron Ec48 family effector membrane protein [Pantoea stewartii]